jgi:hypothetical protein
MKFPKWLFVLCVLSILVILLTNFIAGIAAPLTQALTSSVYLPILQKQGTPTPPPPDYGGNIGALAFSPAYLSDTTLLVGASQGLFMTIDGGDIWSQIADSSSKDLAFSPGYSNDHTIFQAAGIFVYKTTDWGSWYGTSPWAPYYVHSLAISPQYSVDQTIFAGTWAGVARSSDQGATWEQFSNSPVMVRSLVLTTNYPTDLTLFAATDNQGCHLECG